MTARPISALLPVGLPPVTASEIAGYCDAVCAYDVTNPFAGILGALTHDVLIARQTLRQAITKLRNERRRLVLRGRTVDVRFAEATVLMLWRLSREVGR